MGIKAIKEKYKIKHIVQKEGDNILIGSAYAQCLIMINLEGEIVQMYKNRKYDDGWNTNEDLKRYQEEMIVDQESGKLKELVNSKDEVGKLVPVFTHKAGRVIKTYCETLGWPNTTVDGELMYENSFYPTYKQAYKSLLADTRLKYTWKTWRMAMSNVIDMFLKANKWMLIDVSEYVYSRTIQRIVGIFY